MNGNVKESTMPVIPVYVGRLDFGSCSGMVFSYDPITTKKLTIDGAEANLRFVAAIKIQTPEGYVLENVREVNPYGDTGFTKMVFDPGETAKGTSGRVYMRAARLVERMRSGPGEFVQVL
jgi:hypothetical protein